MVFKLARYDENDNEVPIEKAYIDGYLVGGRLLEGVIFEISLSKSKKAVNVKCINGGTYFEDLNTKKWLAEVKKYAIEHDDEISLDMNGSDIGNVILVDNDALPLEKPIPIQFSMPPSSSEGILEDILKNK